MFDIAFSELIIIALVALVIIGPERLPRVARTAGHLLGRLQRYVGDVKADINREIQLEELQKVQREMEQSVREVESSVSRELGAVESSLNNSIAPPAEAAPAAESAAERAALEPPAPAAAPETGVTDAPGAEPARAPQMELGLEPQQGGSKHHA